jgi:DNA mismatch repair ATPase MutS
MNKIMQLGGVLETFYQLHCDEELHHSFLYSFGFHGYLDNVQGLQANLRAGKMHYATLQLEKGKEKEKEKGKEKEKEKGKEKEKEKRNKKENTEFKGLYSPIMMDPVYNDVSLAKNLVITGPNASGKTTILKSCLVNILLSQQVGCGFFTSATLIPYQHLHCYLNIPDTSGRDSLFQAEARRCKNILDEIDEKKKSGDRHMCVFDELYSGTNPEEAVSSAFAFLLYLGKNKNIDCLLTTHFYDLCQHLETGEKSRYVNMSMKTEITSSGEFMYIYQLTKGISKVKGGIQILTDMKYPQEILDQANWKEKEMEETFVL